MKLKQTTALMLGACLAVSATAAEKLGGRPSDIKAREIFAKVISIPTELGRNKVPEMAEYLAQEFRAGGFPAEDVVVTPIKMSGDQTATLTVRYRGDGSGGKPILLMAHMDVVTAKREEWERDPYQLIEENGYLLWPRHRRHQVRASPRSPRLSCG